MPDCVTCTHPNTLHAGATGGCSVPGCACDELQLEEMTPDVPPPKPGTCVHLHGEGSIWVLESMDEVSEKLAGAMDFAELTICDFEGEDHAYCNFPVRLRPQIVSSYHVFPEERWALVLKQTM